MKKSPWILVAGLVAMAVAVYYFFLRKGAGPAAGKTAAGSAAAGKGNALMQAVPNVLDRLINPTATRANNGDIRDSAACRVEFYPFKPSQSKS